MKHGLPVAAKRMLIDLSNLRTGGGLQVGISVVDEIANLSRERFPQSGDVRIEISTAVWDGLRPDTRVRLPLVVVDRRWHTWRSWIARLEFDVALVLFGPLYGRRRARRQIVGFGDNTVTHGNVVGVPRLDVKARVRASIRRAISRRLFRRADTLVVESPRTKLTLMKQMRLPSERIEVVENAYHRVFDQASFPAFDSARLGLAGVGSEPLLFAFIGRGYPHKNHVFCGLVGRALAMRGWRDVRFVFTLTSREWASMPELTRRFSINVGPVQIQELPGLYSVCHAGFFPSLLESYSVTPLEVMRMGLPLFASDRDFVRDFCDDIPFYFDPLDADNAAEVIRATWRDSDLLQERAAAGRRYAQRLPSAADRAKKYLTLLEGP